MRTTLEYAPSALSDLEEIRQYISEELQNPNASAETVQRILKRIVILREFPNAGPQLVDYFGSKSIYRYLVCGDYVAIYRYNIDTVTILRVLYHKRDFKRVQFDE